MSDQASLPTDGSAVRGCYCDLWSKKPSVLEQQGLVRGFCGRCQRCRAPGHTRHHPGAVPVTGAWCDRHYRILSLVHPLAPRGMLLWLCVMAGLLALVLRLR